MALGDGVRRNIAHVEPTERAMLRTRSFKCIFENIPPPGMTTRTTNDSLRRNHTTKLCRGLALGALLILWSALPASAQAAKGDKEILLHGDVTGRFGGDAESATTGTVAAGLGYYFTNRVELFGSVDLSINHQGTAGTSADAGFGTAFRYNISQPDVKLVPYVGLEYSLNSMRNPKDSSFIEPNGGVKYYIRRNVAFDVNASYGHALFSSGGGSVIRESVGLVFGF
jgi:hypothetical protein